MQITDDRLRAAYRCKAGLNFTTAPDGLHHHNWAGGWEWKLLLEKTLP